METFLNQIVAKVNNVVLSSIHEKLNEFANLVAELPEMKEKGVTAARVIEMWNSTSDFKVTHSVQSVASTAVGGTSGVSGGGSEEKKARVKTDKNKKCQVPKTRGDNAGQPCGKNCVIDTDYCSEHLKKYNKTSDNSVGTAVANGVSAQVPQSVPNGVTMLPTATGATALPVPAGSTAVCQHILVSGANKGNPCGKKVNKEGKWCTAHAKKY
jgi:hypothetical protein